MTYPVMALSLSAQRLAGPDSVISAVKMSINLDVLQIHPPWGNRCANQWVIFQSFNLRLAAIRPIPNLIIGGLRSLLPQLALDYPPVAGPQASSSFLKDLALTRIQVRISFRCTST